jgi:hypothetical protein
MGPVLLAPDAPGLSVPSPPSGALEPVRRTPCPLPLDRDGLRCLRVSLAAPPLLQSASFVRQTRWSQPLVTLRGLPPARSLSVVSEGPGGRPTLLFSSDCESLHDLSLLDAQLGRCEAQFSATRAQGVTSWEGSLRSMPLRLLLANGESPSLELSGKHAAVAADACGRLRATLRGPSDCRLVLHSGLNQSRPGAELSCGVQLPMDVRADVSVSAREPNKGLVLEVGRKLPRQYGGSYVSYVQRWGGSSSAPRRQLKLSSKAGGEEGRVKGSHSLVWAEGEAPRATAEWGGPSADSPPQSELGASWTFGFSGAEGDHWLLAFSRGFEEA